jgi:hypothetical protein
MKIFPLIILLAIGMHPAFAQMKMEDRMNLQNLLAERARNFSAYTSSIQKRSGIFGNKTKADILKSNEVLLDIVTLDNDIMDALKRALTYKTFEKTTDNYSKTDCEMKLQHSMQVTDTLMKQLTVAEDKIKRRNTSASLYKIFFFVALAGCASLLVLLKRKQA